jgi:hypothetical protein
MMDQEEQVATMSALFEGQYDKDTLLSVLRANGNSLERAIDSLLQGPPGSHGGEAAPSTSQDEEIARQLQREMAAEADLPPLGIARPSSAAQASPPAPEPSPASVSAGRGSKVRLPGDFLRVPGGKSTGSDQIVSDARLAIMLQNADFRAAHPEFDRQRSGGAPASRPTSQGSGDGVLSQIRSMGDDVKRNLSALAVKWNIRAPGKAADSTEYASLANPGNEDEDGTEVVDLDGADRSVTHRRMSSTESDRAGASLAPSRKKDN